MTPEQLAIKNVGKQDPKRHLEEKVILNRCVLFLGTCVEIVVTA